MPVQMLVKQLLSLIIVPATLAEIFLKNKLLYVGAFSLKYLELKIKYKAKITINKI